MDVGNPARWLAGQTRGEEELGLPPLGVGQVRDRVGDPRDSRPPPWPHLADMLESSLVRRWRAPRVSLDVDDVPVPDRIP